MVANTDQRDTARKITALIASAFALANNGNRSEQQIDLLNAALKTFVLQRPCSVSIGPSRCTCGGIFPDGDDTCSKCHRISQTRQEKEDPIKLLTTLCGQATGLINQNKRTDAEMLKLANTLQFFKDLPSVKNQSTPSALNGQTRKCECGAPLAPGEDLCIICRTH